MESTVHEPAYEDWVPQEIRTRFPSLEEALRGLEKDKSCREAALVCFWRVYWNLDQVEPIKQQLDGLVSCLYPEHIPDERPSLVQGFIYIHMVAAKALWLKKKELGSSEEFIDSVEKGCSVFNRTLSPVSVISYDRENIMDEALAGSFCTVSGIMLLELFRIRKAEGKYEEALKLFCDALRCWLELGEDKATGDFYHAPYDFYLPYCGERKLAHVFKTRCYHEQEPVEVVNALAKPSSADVNWRNVANYCKRIDDLCYKGEGLEESTAIWTGEGLPEELPWMQFWQVALCYARRRMSPDEYRKLREGDEAEESQRRLKTYFFKEIWEDLPEQTCRALVNADRVYWFREEGRPEAIFNELRLALEAILRPVIWELYETWLNSSHRLEDLKEINRAKEQLRKWKDDGKEFTLGQMLYMWNKYQAFGKFLNSKYPGKEEFLRDLRESLKELNPKRISAEHPKSGYSVGSQDIDKVFRDFVGIGCEGILSKLVKLSKKGTPPYLENSPPQT